MTVEGRLEKFLEVGTWLSTLVVGIGVVFSMMLITKIGIGMFILIPIVRVAGLIINFYGNKDFKMFGVALIVFCIILISLGVGIIAK